MKNIGETAICQMSARCLSKILLFLVTFKMYGEGRCMMENFGFSLRGMLAGAMLAFGFAFVASALLLFVHIVKNKSECACFSNSAAFKYSLVVFLGIVFSESWISFDEYRFSQKIFSYGMIEKHRPRSFPFKGYDLHYENARGIWTTD